jgi:AcrR family transcriptional regulator
MATRELAVASARRRRPSRGDLKEHAILETAERLLAEKSIHEIGVDELAQGAKISRPSFYFYFESKFAVLQALVDRVVQETYAEAERWLEREQEAPEEAVRRSIERGQPFGAASWQAEIAARLGLESLFRPRGRPRTKTNNGS